MDISVVLTVLEKSVFTWGYRQVTRDMTTQWRDNGMTSHYSPRTTSLIISFSMVVL